MTLGIALFAQAQKGVFSRLITLHSLEKLHEVFGMPPENSKGMWYSIQFLMQNEMIYFYRVAEEGFSYNQYCQGLELLKHYHVQYPLKAICMPGVGSRELIDKATQFCKDRSIIFLCTAEDFYDYATDF